MQPPAVDRARRHAIPRDQGVICLADAIAYFTAQGTAVSLPLIDHHSPQPTPSLRLARTTSSEPTASFDGPPDQEACGCAQSIEAAP